MHVAREAEVTFKVCFDPNTMYCDGCGESAQGTFDLYAQMSIMSLCGTCAAIFLSALQQVKVAIEAREMERP